VKIPRFISSATGQATRFVGRTYDYATPGAGTSRLTEAGRAISDPNRVWSPSAGGGPIPGGFVTVNQPAPAVGGGGEPQVQSANVAVPEAGLYGAYGGGSGAAYDPNKDPANIARVRGEVSGLMGAFEAAFNDAMSKVDALAQQKKGEFAEKYKQAKETLTQTYGDTSNQIDNQMSARGAYNSSYRANEQGTAKNAFDTAYGNLGQAEEQDVASVGQFASEQKAQLAGARPNFNLNDYNDVGDLLSVKQSVDQAVKQLQTTGAGLLTSSAYRDNLNKIAPETADAGNAALKDQLARLAGTNANPEAKRFIAQQTISDAGQDPAAWMDYFEQQLGATGSQPNPEQALVVQ